MKLDGHRTVVWREEASAVGDVAEPLDVHVHQLAGPVTFVASYGPAGRAVDLISRPGGRGRIEPCFVGNDHRTGSLLVTVVRGAGCPRPSV